MNDRVKENPTGEVVQKKKGLDPRRGEMEAHGGGGEKLSRKDQYSKDKKDCCNTSGIEEGGQKPVGGRKRGRIKGPGITFSQDGSSCHSGKKKETLCGLSGRAC